MFWDEEERTAFKWFALLFITAIIVATVGWLAKLSGGE